MTNKILAMLETRQTSKATILKEEDVVDVLTKAKAKNKTQMIMALYDANYQESTIAATLERFGILGPKSARQHVRNTVERVLGQRARNK